MRMFLLLVLMINFNAKADSDIDSGGGYDFKAAEKAEAQKVKAEHDKEVAEKKAQQRKIKAAKLEAQKRADLEEKARDELSRKPESIAKISDSQLCVNAGKDIRSNTKNDFLDALKARHLTINVAKVKDKKIGLGDSECSVYASWGFPERANKSVSIDMVRNQLIYGETYLYLENGYLTSYDTHE